MGRENSAISFQRSFARNRKGVVIAVLSSPVRTFRPTGGSFSVGVSCTRADIGGLANVVGKTIDVEDGGGSGSDDDCDSDDLDDDDIEEEQGGIEGEGRPPLPRFCPREFNFDGWDGSLVGIS